MKEQNGNEIFENPALAEIFKPVQEPPAPEDAPAEVETAIPAEQAMEEPDREEKALRPGEPLPLRSPAAAYMNIFLCFFVLVVVSVLALALPKPTESEYERRELAKLPEFSIAAYMTKEYNEGVEAFYADTFPFRDELVKIRSLIEDARGMHMDDVKIHGAAPLPSDDDIPDVNDPTPPPPQSSIPQPENSESASESQQSQSVPEPPPDDGAVGEMVNNVFVYKDMAMELFGGSRAMAEYYASVINDYQAKLGGSARIYNVVVPTHVEFALPEKYASLSNSEKKNIDYIYSLLDSGVTAVDAYSKLAEHQDEYIYFKTDHHWTGLGAYYAYTAFAEQAGFTPYGYEDYTKHTISPFVGTLYGVTGQDPRLQNANDYVEWCEIPVSHRAYHYLRYDPYTSYNINNIMADYASGGNAYSVYLHGDYPLTVAETDINNGRRAVIIKESYGNAFSTYLVPHFEKTFIVDERYFQMNMQEFVENNGITDIIIVNNCFAANTNYHISNISNLLYQATPSYEQVQQWKEQAAQSSSSSSSEEKDDGEEEPKTAIRVEG